jgi:hypothetical protein
MYLKTHRKTDCILKAKRIYLPFRDIAKESYLILKTGQLYLQVPKIVYNDPFYPKCLEKNIDYFFHNYTIFDGNFKTP